MLNRVFGLWVILWVFFFSQAAYLQESRPYVVLISIDGLRPDAITAQNAPYLTKMRSQGAWALNARTIVPSITLPSHTSMLTGRDSVVHKVLWNKYEPERGVISYPTCLKLAHDAGFKAAMFVNKEKFKHLYPEGSLNDFQWAGNTALEAAKAFGEYVVKNGLPNATFIHFADPDVAGHKEGWMSEAYIAGVTSSDKAFEEVRQAVGKAGKLEQTVFIVTADHGGKDKQHEENIPEDRNIPWLIFGKDVAEGRELAQPIITYDTAATVLSLLQLSVPKEWEGHPVAFPVKVEAMKKPALVSLSKP